MAEAQAAASATKVTARHKLRALARKKKKAKILADKEFAKAFFEGKSKRSNDKKTAFRKRHAKK